MEVLTLNRCERPLFLLQIDGYYKLIESVLEMQEIEVVCQGFEK